MASMTTTVTSASNASKPAASAAPKAAAPVNKATKVATRQIMSAMDFLLELTGKYTMEVIEAARTEVAVPSVGHVAVDLQTKMIAKCKAISQKGKKVQSGAANTAAAPKPVASAATAAATAPKPAMGAAAAAAVPQVTVKPKLSVSQLLTQALSNPENKKTVTGDINNVLLEVRNKNGHLITTIRMYKDADKLKIEANGVTETHDFETNKAVMINAWLSK